TCVSPCAPIASALRTDIRPAGRRWMREVYASDIRCQWVQQAPRYRKSRATTHLSHAAISRGDADVKLRWRWGARPFRGRVAHHLRELRTTGPGRVGLVEPVLPVVVVGVHEGRRFAVLQVVPAQRVGDLDEVV